MRITSKGQVTIPQAIREKAGLHPNTEVEFKYENGRVVILPTKIFKRPTRGETIVGKLRGIIKSGLTTDEVMAMTRGYEPLGVPARRKKPA